MGYEYDNWEDNIPQEDDRFDPWEDVRERVRISGMTSEKELLADADALLAVVKVTQIELGMTVPELLMIVAKDIETDREIEAVDVLAVWLRSLADGLEKALAALSEHLK